ncbi:hypothetical protein QL093DRAFT_2281811 [Fusarium oxysporum]|nr:hypothetical protein QL093DRAFT_2281811 [Fusarium oxysporum]
MTSHFTFSMSGMLASWYLIFTQLLHTFITHHDSKRTVDRRLIHEFSPHLPISTSTFVASKQKCTLAFWCIETYPNAIKCRPFH